MGIFTQRGGAAPPTRPEARAAELTTAQLASLAPEFEAVGEALASGRGELAEAYAVLGQGLAAEGVSLDEALSGLHTTFQAVIGTEPTFEDTRAFSVAWSESILGYLHRLSCEDPVTGLATVAHLQTRLTELYRGEESCGPVGDSYALVVVDVGPPAGEGTGVAVLADDLRTARAAEAVRGAFAGPETVARLAQHRLAVLAPRDARLVRRVGLAQRLVEPVATQEVRVWIEGLPGTAEAAAATLAELARL